LTTRKCPGSKKTCTGRRVISGRVDGESWMSYRRGRNRGRGLGKVEELKEGVNELRRKN